MNILTIEELKFNQILSQRLEIQDILTEFLLEFCFIIDSY